MLLATMFVPAAVFGQEPQLQEKPEFQMEMRARQMELEQREVEMDMQRKMQELELEKHKIELEHMRRGHKHRNHPLLFLVVVVHILVAVWIYKDIRQRNAGSGIWIVIALVAGLLGALVYAVVRLGDMYKGKA